MKLSRLRYKSVVKPGLIAVFRTFLGSRFTLILLSLGKVWESWYRASNQCSARSIRFLTTEQVRKNVPAKNRTWI